MTQYAIVTDCEQVRRAASPAAVACKAVNDVPVGQLLEQGAAHRAERPDRRGRSTRRRICTSSPCSASTAPNPECVTVCPTEASHIAADGTVQIDKSKCIGCQFCAMACPYGVRYLNEEEGVVEKCTLCEQKIAQGELPQCVAAVRRARPLLWRFGRGPRFL